MSKIRKSWLLSIMLVLVVALVATGCANDTTEEPVEDATEEVTDATDEATDKVEDAVEDAEDDLRDMNYEDIEITAEDVFDKFMEEHPDAKITEIDLDKELMEYQYVVEGYDSETKYELKIDPVDARIISDDQEVFDLDDEEGAEITKDHLANFDSIIEKAKLEDGSDSELDEWNISVDDGRVIMKVEIGVQTYSYDMETELLVED